MGTTTGLVMSVPVAMDEAVVPLAKRTARGLFWVGTTFVVWCDNV